MACALFATAPVFAVELWANEEGDKSIALGTTLKFTGFGSRSPDDRLLFPERTIGTALTRLRLNFSAEINEWINAGLAYEQRASVVSTRTGSGGGGGVLPSFGGAPYRVKPLDWQILDAGTRLAYGHEIDRAFLAMHPSWGEITIGRQAIGLGRGVLFGAVDMFSTFGTVEVDREWRRGIDALRIEYRLSDTSSVELIAVFGRSRDDSALLGRLRGFIGNFDAELIVGKRARDNVFAGILSGNLGDAEVHLELAVFNTPESQPDGGLFGKDDLVGKAVFGGSYTFDVGRGLTVFAEYHYSGFGVKDLSDALGRLLDRAFQERLLRGDMQILGRHALAIQLSYQLTDTLSAGLLALQSPTDGSGLGAPSLIWSHSENATLSASLFVPWGASPRHGRLESEFGASPISLFAQWTRYF